MDRLFAQRMVVRLLREQVGLEVGDYGRDWLPVQSGSKRWAVKLEGWGYDCVGNDIEMEGMSEDSLKGVAMRRAAELALEWANRWPVSGVVPIEGDEVWAVTWAAAELPADVEIEDEEVVPLD